MEDGQCLEYHLIEVFGNFADLAVGACPLAGCFPHSSDDIQEHSKSLLRHTEIINY